jgi:hypothetical protein
MAQRSASAELRAAAAKAVSTLLPQAKTKATREELREIRDIFAGDISHIVRAASSSDRSDD